MDADRVPQLDFTSENFDPTFVLSADNVELPYPDAETFETVSDYQKVVEKNMDRSQLESAHMKNKRERMDRLKAMTTQPENENPNDETEEVRTKRSHRNVFTFMEKSVSNGPLGVLVKCMNERIKVKIWTRNYKYVRGVCTGFIEAFDKHWNVALSDVDESFVKYNKAKSPATAENVDGEERNMNIESDKSLGLECAQIGSVCVKKTGKLKTFQRHLNKLFIRGDNIILISIVN